MESSVQEKMEAGESWYDWKWQTANKIRDLKSLKALLPLSPQEEQAFVHSDRIFNFGVSPYYLALVDQNNPACPVRKQIIPSLAELQVRGSEKSDPLAEEKFTVATGLVHRFPDRVLWYLSHHCGAYCRFCTRKRKVADSSSRPDRQQRQQALDYIRHNSSIREVILSGGDPLTLSDSFLSEVLADIRSIPHINQIRIHTRMPVVMPMRITEELCSVFSSYFPLYIVTHFNHASEITAQAAAALKKLATLGNCVLLNQNVLLAGINDDAEVLKQLYYKLVALGVKPYYLHHCDEVYGITSFRVPYRKGMAIMKQLRSQMSGICVPEFVVDLEGAQGKIPIYEFS